MKRELREIAEHAARSEKALERRLVKECEKQGLLCLKYTNAIQAGYPDRQIVLPDGMVVWAEIKSRGKKPTPLQERRHEQLRRLGHRVDIIDSPESIDHLMYDLSAFKPDEV